MPDAGVHDKARFRMTAWPGTELPLPPRSGFGFALDRTLIKTENQEVKHHPVNEVKD